MDALWLPPALVRAGWLHSARDARGGYHVGTADSAWQCTRLSVIVLNWFQCRCPLQPFDCECIPSVMAIMIASGRGLFRVLFTGVLNKGVFCDFILYSCFMWFESETDLPCVMYFVFYCVPCICSRACRVRGTVGDSGLCCRVYVRSFECYFSNSLVSSF